MSRRNTHQGGGGRGRGGRNAPVGAGAGAGAGDAALLAANRVLSAEAEYRKNVKQMQATACLLADRIAHGGDVEVALLGDEGGDGDPDNKTAAFLTDQRERLKALCEGNVRRNKDVDTFVSAVRDIRDDLLAGQQRERAARAQDEQGGDSEGGDAPEDDDLAAVDYEASIRDRIEALKRANEETALDPRDEQFCRDVRKRLNEKEPKKSRGSRGGDDEDDDLEVMANTNQDGGGGLKCPISGMLFEDPVKNKVCGHTYSRAGVRQMFRNNKHNCPIPGCGNGRVTEEQLEEDMEMAMKVQRHQRRVRQEEEQRARDRAMEEEDEEEEFDEGENGGFTVVK